MEYLQFKVDGEFVCRLARTWFWDENRPYEKCEELLLCCLGTDELTLEEKKQIVVEILEGRKILVGINTVRIVDDNENVRPIHTKIDEYRKKEMLRAIEDDMEIHALLYVDMYAAKKENDTFDEFLDISGSSIERPDDVVRWLYSDKNMWTGRYTLSDEFYYQKGLKMGAYLMNAYLVYELFGKPLSMVPEEEKYDKLYQYWKEKGDICVDVECRQRLYKAKMNIKACNTKEIEGNLDELYTSAEPDEFLSPYGLIDRQGNYYSCGFGAHNAKAFTIIKENPARFGITIDELYMNSTKELDILFDKGWIIVHNPNLSGNPFFSLKDGMVATKRQVNTAFDYMAHFNRTNMGGMRELMKEENL